MADWKGAKEDFFFFFSLQTGVFLSLFMAFSAEAAKTNDMIHKLI